MFLIHQVNAFGGGTVLQIYRFHLHTLHHTHYYIWWSWTILIVTTWQARSFLVTFGKVRLSTSPNKWRSKYFLLSAFTWAKFTLSSCLRLCHGLFCSVFSSPARASVSGSSSRWSKQEKDLFEEGLVSSPFSPTSIAYIILYSACLHVFLAKWMCGFLCKSNLIWVCCSTGSVWSKMD